jgi:hypothetical protein
MARRGRPRDPNAKRRQTTMAGRAPAVDHGTTQLQLHRARLLGAPVHGIEDGQVITDHNLALAASGLGVLLARGVINRRQFDAAERYQALAWAAYGRPFTRAVDIARPRGEGSGDAEIDASDTDDRRRTGARRMLARADTQLAALGSGVPRAVKQACQFEKPPSPDDRLLLRAGLDVLAGWWGLGPPSSRICP